MPREDRIDALLSNVPRDLTERKQWVVWRYELRKDKWTKVPFQAGKTRYQASTTDPRTWETFKLALAAFRAFRSLNGVGFVFAADDPFVGIDFDKCLTDSGSLEHWAFVWVQRLRPCYIEVSPSGTGLKAFVRGGPLPPKGKERGRNRGGYGPDREGKIEIFDRARYFTVTGDLWHP